MDKDRIVGSAKDIGGKLEGAVGDATGDVRTQASGFAREAEQDVDFDAVGELDVFEEIKYAAAETGANFADVAGRRLRGGG